MTPTERGAFVSGMQLMAIVAGVFINCLGWLVGANYYIASLPFIIVSIVAPVFISKRQKP